MYYLYSLDIENCVAEEPESQELSNGASKYPLLPVGNILSYSILRLLGSAIGNAG